MDTAVPAGWEKVGVLELLSVFAQDVLPAVPCSLFRGHSSSESTELKSTAEGLRDREEPKPSTVLTHFAVHLDYF